MIMFGGNGSGRDKSFNDVHKYDLHKKTWQKLEAFGQTPAAREAHIAQVICDDKMIVHGGISSEGTSFDDTWVLATFNSKLDRLQGQMSFSNTLS
jgi:N-acetylneuraminic acid mutarotase